MKTFLQLKHWHVFFLISGIPIVFLIIAKVILITSDNQTTRMTLNYIPFINIIFTTAFFGWLYIIATALHSKLPDSVKMNLTRYKIFFFLPLFSFLWFLCVEIASYGQLFPPGTVLIILPLYLFSISCLFYNLFFVSKTLKSVELQRQVTFRDYARDFFLLCLFPIGVWFIQSRINKMFAGKTA